MDKRNKKLHFLFSEGEESCTPIPLESIVGEMEARSEGGKMNRLRYDIRLIVTMNRRMPPMTSTSSTLSFRPRDRCVCYPQPQCVCAYVCTVNCARFDFVEIPQVFAGVERRPAGFGNVKKRRGRTEAESAN